MYMMYNGIKVNVIDRRSRVTVISYLEDRTAQRVYRTVPNTSLSPITETNKLGIRVL